METSKDILTFRETMRLLRVSKPTLIKIIRDHEDFPARKLGGQWRIIRGDLMRWLKNNHRN